MRSAIGVPAVFDREDLDGVAAIIESHAVVAEPEAQLGRSIP